MIHPYLELAHIKECVYVAPFYNEIDLLWIKWNGSVLHNVPQINLLKYNALAYFMDMFMLCVCNYAPAC